MNERILGKTERERREIYAPTPLWVALRWLVAVLFYTARYRSATAGLEKADRLIRNKDKGE